MKLEKSSFWVKLITGIIINPKLSLNEVELSLKKEFGPIDNRSSIIPFNFTQYYEAEMGGNLLRLWLSFENLIEAEKLSRIKIVAEEIEKYFSRNGNPSDPSVRSAAGRRTGRQVNLDPGYLTPASLVLATTKNYAHRIYLGKRIFAEVTLLYRKGKFVPLDWTYPDYRRPEALDFFRQVRKKYLHQLREKNI